MTRSPGWNDDYSSENPDHARGLAPATGPATGQPDKRILEQRCKNQAEFIALLLHFYGVVEASMRKDKRINQFLNQGFWHAHHVDIVWRMDGKDIGAEADWLKDIWYALRAVDKASEALPAPLESENG